MSARLSGSNWFVSAATAAQDRAALGPLSPSICVRCPAFPRAASRSGLVAFHLLQLGSGGFYERDLLVDGVSQELDDLPDLLGCHSSAAGSGGGWLCGG